MAHYILNFILENIHSFTEQKNFLVIYVKVFNQNSFIKTYLNSKYILSKLLTVEQNIVIYLLNEQIKNKYIIYVNF